MEHSFDVNVACEFGEFAATLLKNFQFWILKNKANDKHFHDGHYWTYNSQKALAELFPYKTRDQLRRAIDELVERGVLIKGNYNAMPTDRTIWYAFRDEEIWLAQNSPMHLANLPNGIGENAKPIPYNKPDINNTTPPPTHTCEEKEGIEILFGWLRSSDLVEWTKRKLLEKGLNLTIEEIARNFYENDFRVRQRCQNREHTEVLSHYQNWLPTYLTKLQDDTKRHKDTRDNSQGSSRQYENTLLR